MINQLREALLKALENDDNSLISETIKAIQIVLECDMCTLWSINYNNTDKALGEFASASILVRCIKNGLKYPSCERCDYVHPLDSSFIDKVLKELRNTGKNYKVCNIEDDICKNHKSFDSLKTMGLLFFISIPIKKGKKDVAFLKLAYKNKPSFIEEKEEENIISVINQAVVSALSRHLIYQKQQLLADLIKNYGRKKISNLKDIFHPIIHTILKKYFDYEGSSVFIWDSMNNRYNLLVTTGLKNISDKDVVYYEKGEGITGTTAKDNEVKIYDDLIDLEQKKDPKYLHKYRENTTHKGETMLAVPIVRSTDKKEVFGIIRFTNKINHLSKIDNHPAIDFFNDTDVELIEDASHYLALNIENYLAEEERRDFISKMSHEFKTPANAIRVSANRIQRKQSDIIFMGWHFNSYLQDIIDFSELQLMQVRTNLFLTKKFKSEDFSINNYYIKDIIEESIRIVRPIARDYNVLFDNIHIDENFPKVLIKVDKDTFKIIFYNLLTNAIKYAHPNREFGVLFQAEQKPEGLSIYISDNGIGISINDVERIFLLGVRSNYARKINADGYGIGLYVIKHLVNIYDGTICVSNGINPTTFEIKLPKKIICNL